MAKILVFDIETTPSLGYVWGKWQQDVLGFTQEWQMLCFGYKWLGSKELITVGMDKFSEEILVRRLHALFDEADIVVAHNGQSFDVKMCNAKFLEFGIDPPSPYRVIDTKIVAKRYFRFVSNKLDDLGDKLGVGRKVQTGGFSLWLGCMANDPKSWTKMLRYNAQDVRLLEKIYLKLRPWMDNHPSVSLLDGLDDGCPKCGSTKLEKRGTRKTKVAINQRYKCNGCGGWCHSRKSYSTETKFVN